jgi:broad specificity phosphatase PhoE
MQTKMYLIRHAAAEAHFAQPARRPNPPLARLGVRQAEVTRDFLAVRGIDHCYSSPMLRAMQTASIIAAPHSLSPVAVENLVECVVGTGDELESYECLQARVTAALENLLLRHVGRAILVVAHCDVNRAYLAGLLGLNPDQAAQVHIDNCGISLVVREGEEISVGTLNASFHLQGIAA